MIVRPFSEQLRNAVGSDWISVVGHKFVHELAHDRISDHAYARYLVLDYAFLEILVAHVGQAVATAPGMTAKRRYAEFLAVLTGGEDDYFRRSFSAMGVEESRWKFPSAHPVLDGFREVMLTGRHEKNYANVLAALLPVEWVYLSWAQSVATCTPERFYLKEWIELHVDRDFESFVVWMRTEMDEIGTRMTSDQVRVVTDIFRRTVALEVLFFDAAYES